MSLLGPVSLAGNPVVGLDPAINTGSGTGYHVNSVPFLANGDNNPVGTTLGVWTLTDTAIGDDRSRHHQPERQRRCRVSRTRSRYPRPAPATVPPRP